jgi:hypothetical protein
VGEINLSALNYNEILKPSFLKPYEEALDIINLELFRLNSYLFILGKVINFPTDFLSPDRQSFFTLINIAFTESSLLIISKLITDEVNDALLIKRFKDNVCQNVKEKYKEYFYSLLKENSFDNTIKRLKKQTKDIKNVRNNIIAHLLVTPNLQLKDYTNKFSWQKINQITDDINKLFKLLCFDCEHSLLPIDYDPKVQHPAGFDSRSDIEYFLDLIIQDSYLYKMPDESQYWNIEKEDLSPDILKIINEYRRKFGKSEV